MADNQVTLGEEVARTTTATCMDPLCAYHVMATRSNRAGPNFDELREQVRVHVLETSHRVYINETRASIIRRVGTTER